jgi:PAS domain S-box-containing protein
MLKKKSSAPGRVLTATVLNLVMNNTDEPFILLDKNLHIITFNKIARQLYPHYFKRKLKAGDSILQYAAAGQKEILRKRYQNVLRGYQQESKITVPLARGRKKILHIKWSPARNSGNKILGILITASDITRQVVHEENLQKTLHALTERIKEQTCLYKISRLGSRDYNVHELLTEAVKYIPAGWQYPEQTGATIRYDRYTYKTKNFKKTRWVQSAERKTTEGKTLQVQVCYLKKMSDEAEGPFLKEERRLIESLADNLVLSINKIQARKQLFDSQELLKGILQAASDGIYGIDQKGNCTFINHAAARLLGYQPEECIGKNMHRLIHYASRDGKKYPQRECPIYKSRYQRNGCQVEAEVFWRKDGSYFDVSYSSSPIIQNGVHQGAVISFRDITEKKKAEDLLAAERNLLRTLIDNIPDYIYVKDTQCRHLINNKANVELIGAQSEEETLGKTVMDFFDPAVAANFLQDDRIVLSSLKPVINREEPIITKSGEYRWLLTSKLPLLNQHHKATGLIGISRDITEIKKLQELLDIATSLARIGSWEVDLVNGTFYWSEITRKIHEVDDDYVPTLEEAIHFYKEGPSRETIRKCVEQAIADGTPWDVELPLVTAKNKEVWVRAIGQAEFRNGKCVRLFGSFQDIHLLKVAVLEKQKLLEEKNEILESIADNFYALDNEYRYTYINRSALEYLKLSKENTIGQKLFDLFPVLHGTLLHHKLEQARLTQQPMRFEFYYADHDTWFDEAIYPKAEGFSVFFRDITDKKKAERALQLAYEEKNTILESIGDAFFTVDHQFTVTYWNRLAEQMLQTPREKILGKNLWDVFPDAVALPSFTNYHKALRENVTVQFEDYYQPVDRLFEVSAYPSYQGLSVYFKDITERKKAEEKIRQYAERFELAAKATNDAIWDWDLVNNQTTRAGDGFYKIFGYTKEEAGQPDFNWPSKIHPDDREHFIQSQGKALADPNTTFWEDEYRFMRKDGKYIVVHDRAFILRNLEGKAVRMIGAGQDITHRKEYENSLKKLNADLGKYAKELADSNAELEQFAFVASHDLQEPLRMVSSFLTQIEKKYYDKLDERGKQYIRFAVDGASRMRQIILDLLEFSRVGRNDTPAVEINTRQLVEEIKTLLSEQIDEKKAVIQVLPLPNIRAHQAPLHQVFQNLIGNALKYARTDTAPHITVGCDELDQEYRFFVADNGIGIDEEYYEKIFVLFQRLHKKNEYSGTGMGLALCKKIITYMGGRIWVKSELGKGSTFYFTVNK